MDLDFDKYCLVGGSPTTVLPAPRNRSRVASRKPGAKPGHRDDTLSLAQEFEIDLGDHCSVLCVDVQSQRIGREGSESLKRGSVYQSSQEVSLIRKGDAFAGRQKIEFSPRTASMLSVETIDSLCSSVEETSVMAFFEQSRPYGYGDGVGLCSDDSSTTLHEPPHSPAHLHGLVKQGKKHGLPFFHFSVKSLEDVYVAKVDNASGSVYTFHSVPSRRNRSCNTESSMVGRMHVSNSFHLHRELKGAGQPNAFVLYDVLHSRNQFGSSTEAKSHPELEIAAIVMQDPNLLDCSTSSTDKMLVVVPDGNHSLSSTGSRGPSPLLDRWRLGGGCDCGGWDMACPLTVFTKAPSLSNNRHCTELFAQGRKESIAAFTMRAMEDGIYAVDFHAQLSSPQAFSICIAILHNAEETTKPGGNGEYIC